MSSSFAANEIGDSIVAVVTLLQRRKREAGTMQKAAWFPLYTVRLLKGVVKINQ
jgi:hypothetical protein